MTRRIVEFALDPLGAAEDVGEHRWRFKAGPASFALRPITGGYPEGWVVMRAHLDRRGADYHSALFVETGESGDAAERIPIPITRKGKVLQVVRLPRNVRRLVWQPLGSPGVVRHGPMTMAEIGLVARKRLMLRRVVPMLFSLPVEARRDAGLTWSLALTNLPQAYRSASHFHGYSTNTDYDEWIARYGVLSERDRAAIRAHIERFGSYPRFVVVVPVVGAERGGVDATLRSLDEQTYRNFTVTVLDAGGAVTGAYDPDVTLPEPGIGSRVVAAGRIRAVLDQMADELEGRSPAQYVLVIPAGARLAEHALYWIAAEVVANPGAALVYADDDTVGETGRRSAPRFKPDWSPEHLRSTDYIGRAAAFRSDEFARGGGLAHDYCFGDGHAALLRMTDAWQSDAVRHVPAVLFHFPQVLAGDGAGGDAAGAHALAAHLSRSGIAAEVSATMPGCYRLRYALPDPLPLVSILVPTRDGLDLLRQCVESIVSKTSYPCYEILVVDNGSVEPPTLAYLERIAGWPGVRVLRYDRPFNFSAINNFAAGVAQGEVLCLMNNDAEVISPDWLEEMVSRLAQPGVGVVGAKLYYPDGHVQHAGDAVGPGGTADHLHSGLARDAPGYCNRAVVAQEVSAVTAACMVTWCSLYQELGGLDEKDLAVAFNDVDYCLKVWASGRRVIFTPHAELYHHESATRGADESPEKQAQSKREAGALLARWRARMAHDPYYNPNLNYRRPDFSLGTVPLVRRPWLGRR